MSIFKVREEALAASPASGTSVDPRWPGPTPSVHPADRWRWWLTEAATIAGLYGAYTAVRDVIHGTATHAIARGLQIVRAEQDLHLDPERGLNRLVAAHPILATICDYDYAIAHFVVTAGVLLTLYLRRGQRARPIALALYATNLLALIGFYFYPLAPPRLLTGAGFVDTVVVFHTWGSWGSNAVTSVANQYAAMPSLHIAWACWATAGVWLLTSRWWLRAVAVLYPAWTVFVVLGTANHYLADVLAGTLTAGAGFGLALGLNAVFRRIIDARVTPAKRSVGA